MAFALSITFPLGFYQGRDPHGEPELFPTMNRLYSALVAAAFEADIPDPPRDQLLDTLLWLEGNPPDAVSLPDARPSWLQHAIAYRDKGTSRTEKSGTVHTQKLQAERASRASALDGPVVFWWEEGPGVEKEEVLSALAAEIPYVGERPSLARVEATTQRQIPADTLPVTKNYLLPDRAAVRMEYPEEGRLRELMDAYNATRPKRPPTDKQDLPASKEDEQLSATPRRCVGQTRYRKPSLRPVNSPWTSGFLIEIRRHVPARDQRKNAVASEDDAVGWSVALHRAIIKQLGWGAPAMVTGKWATRAEQPPNHMAIQMLPPGLRPDGWEPAATASFAVLFPPEATASEMSATRSALRAIRSLYRGNDGKLLLGPVRDFDPTRFWAPPSAGKTRWWRPTPGAVVEIRARQRGPHGNRWSLHDALLLAVGFVWKDRFDVAGLRGRELYVALAQGVEGLGVETNELRKVHPRIGVAESHRREVPDVLTLVSGQIDLAPLGVSTQLAAIGQSRHLGGGLLLPQDLGQTPGVEDAR